MTPQANNVDVSSDNRINWWDDLLEVRSNDWVQELGAREHLTALFLSLHMLYEECKLSILDHVYLLPLSNLLAGICEAAAPPFLPIDSRTGIITCETASM